MSIQERDSKRRKAYGESLTEERVKKKIKREERREKEKGIMIRKRKDGKEYKQRKGKRAADEYRREREKKQKLIDGKILGR